MGIQYEITRSGFNLLYSKFGLLRFDRIGEDVAAKVEEEYPEAVVSSTGIHIRGIRIATVLVDEA